ncbi:eukaryotic translation initiation factor 3 subunit i [Arctopsyche grandis]|uniref:eukaryotic translation initiation factor 3 subunit i n=1 Tax=Arctopsyche grandis TaxID=121162 RepID=UPI00406D64EB
MKPLLLQGHERAITKIRYNREGDLLFTAGKDSRPNVWWSLNGERLGTFNGHNGVVWCIDVNWHSTVVMSGAGDASCRLWDLATGRESALISCNSAVRTAAFSYSANQAAYSTDRAMRQPCELFIIDTRLVDEAAGAQPTILKWEVTDSKVTSVLWGCLDEHLITGHEDGEIAHWDLRNGKKVHSVKEHSSAINDMSMSRDNTMFITASKDHTAKLFDTSSLELLKEYQTERPVNSAAISPILDHVVLGGGQDAMEVTTTSTRHGKFDSRFFHMIFEEEFGRVKGHFGPINSVAFHPDGKSYASGGEDGFTRVHNFDQSYFDYIFDYSRD